MKYVIANLKMNVLTNEECNRYLEGFRSECEKRASESRSTKVIVCPQVIFANRFKKDLPESIALGAQDVFWEPKGAYTGEVSPISLLDAGVEYVLCGHSERRLYFREGDDVIALKVTSVIEHGIKAVLCVGELEEERERIVSVLMNQIAEATEKISQEQLSSLIIAYEPRWAIGTGKVPSSDDIIAAREIIRTLLVKKYGEAGNMVPILYGGSVDENLVHETCIATQMDGCLVGGASLHPDRLWRVIDAFGG